MVGHELHQFSFGKGRKYEHALHYRIAITLIKVQGSYLRLVFHGHYAKMALVLEGVEIPISLTYNKL